jgi:hypothetical protein
MATRVHYMAGAFSWERRPPCGEGRAAAMTKGPALVTCRPCLRWVDRWVINRIERLGRLA